MESLVQTEALKQGLGIQLKMDTVFRQANIQYPEEQKQAIKLRAQEVGSIEEKLIGWQENGTLVWGYIHYDIAQELGIKYEIEWRSFKSEEEALADIADRILQLPTVTLLAKIEAAKPFGRYWQDKYDRDHPVCKAALQQFGSVDELGIVAVKAGTSRVTVSKVNRILESCNEDLIARCRVGDTSITAAYDLLPGDKNTDSDDPNQQPEVESTGVLVAENKRLAAKSKLKAREISALVKYAIEGFKDGSKLTKPGRKFFIRRWNDEHPDAIMSEDELEGAIENYGTDSHESDSGS